MMPNILQGIPQFPQIHQNKVNEAVILTRFACLILGAWKSKAEATKNRENFSKTGFLNERFLGLWNDADNRMSFVYQTWYNSENS